MKALAHLVLAAVAAFAASPAHAQMNNEMTRLFNEQGNVTKPQVAIGATRGVVTLGNASIKSPIVRTDDLGFHAEMPSITAGCGGIDIQGGALSFPSSERFVEIARAVAANAKGYAFRLALSAVCDKCEAKMTEIQEWINKFGLEQKSSCEIAQSIMDKSGASNAITGWGSRVGANLSLSEGSQPDSYAASGSESGIDPATQAYRDHPEKMKKLMVGNFVWDALDKGDFGSWLGTTNSKDLRQEMMSISGTIIACVAGEDGCRPVEDGNNDAIGLITRSFAPTMTLWQLVGRGDDAKVKVWTCANSDCMDLKEKTISNYRTLTDEIVDAFNMEDGIIDRMALSANQSQPLTSKEAGILAATDDIGEMAVDLARQPNGSRNAKEFIQAYAHVAAARYVHQYLRAAMSELIAVLENDPRAPAVDAVEQVRAAREKLSTDYRQITSMVSSDNAMYANYRAMVEMGRPQSVLAVPQ